MTPVFFFFFFAAAGPKRWSPGGGGVMGGLHPGSLKNRRRAADGTKAEREQEVNEPGCARLLRANVYSVCKCLQLWTLCNAAL